MKKEIINKNGDVIFNVTEIARKYHTSYGKIQAVITAMETSEKYRLRMLDLYEKDEDLFWRKALER